MNDDLLVNIADHLTEYRIYLTNDGDNREVDRVDETLQEIQDYLDGN